MLDYEDRTTITVVRTDTKAAAEGLNINISDKSGNAATGQTTALLLRSKTRTAKQRKM